MSRWEYLDNRNQQRRNLSEQNKSRRKELKCKRKYDNDRVTKKHQKQYQREGYKQGPVEDIERDTGCVGESSADEQSDNNKENTNNRNKKSKKRKRKRTKKSKKSAPRRKRQKRK
eukprot:841359_1